MAIEGNVQPVQTFLDHRWWSAICGFIIVGVILATAAWMLCIAYMLLGDISVYRALRLISLIILMMIHIAGIFGGCFVIWVLASEQEPMHRRVAIVYRASCVLTAFLEGFAVACYIAKDVAALFGANEIGHHPAFEMTMSVVIWALLVIWPFLAGSYLCFLKMIWSEFVAEFKWFCGVGAVVEFGESAIGTQQLRSDQLKSDDKAVLINN